MTKSSKNLNIFVHSKIEQWLIHRHIKLFQWLPSGTKIWRGIVQVSECKNLIGGNLATWNSHPLHPSLICRYQPSLHNIRQLLKTDFANISLHMYKQIRKLRFWDQKFTSHGNKAELYNSFTLSSQKVDILPFFSSICFFLSYYQFFLPSLFGLM